MSVVEIRRETFYKLTNNTDAPEVPSGNRNLYALSKNSPTWSNEISNLTQNIATGEISFKVTGRDPFLGIQANKDEAVGTLRGVRIPVKTGQDIAVQLSNELFVKNFVSYFGSDDKAVKTFKGYRANKFVIPASELAGVSYVSLRFGIKENTQEIGSVHSTKVKVEYGSTHTDWSPALEDLGWSSVTLVSTQEKPYLWKFEYIYYSDGSVEITEPVNLTKQNAQITSRDTIHNIRIAIRDSTDSHNVAFFDNISGIRYQSANLQRFLAGSASILTIEYNSKDIDTIRTGCKLAFIYKERAYWLNIMDLSKKGYKVEITAYSLGLELNQEERGAHKPANAMSFTEYLAYYDPEHALEIGVNEVADKRIKLEWTGTDTILARLFSIANSFDAELEFTVELNQDYSLKRQVLNVYKKGNLGSNRAASPIRVGRGLKVINYSDNLKELRTAVRATGKDGLTIDGLNKKVYDDDGNLLYYSSGMTVYAPQSRDKYPSVGKKSNDNWIVKELGETEYSTKEALWGYMLGELKKICVPEITYDIEGTVDGDVGDTRTLIDDVHYDPPLYVQGRISELTEDLITGKITKSTLTNFERKYSQVASELLKQVEQLANDAAPYIIRLSTDNGFNFKNGKGTSTVTAKLEKYGKIVNANWKWLINNNIVGDKNSVTINASQVIGTLNVIAVATVDGNEAAREYITFTNSDDGVGIKSIKRYYTTNDQAEGVTAGGQNWSSKPATVTADSKYMWSYDVITYTNDTSLVTEPAVIGARGDDGLDADTTGVTEALDKAKQELTALSANIEKVRDDSLAAAEEAKQQLATVANDLGTAKQDLQTQASQLQAQASAQSELTKRVSSVEETANGTKTTVSELSKTVAQNGKDITSVTARTKVVEDDLTNTKTTLSQVQTTADNTSKKTATLENGLDGVKADLAATTTTANTTKTNLANYQASNDKAVANLQSNLQTANGNISNLQTKVEAVPGQITSAVSAVEGKIPKSVGGVNLFKGSRDFSGANWINNNNGIYAEDYQGVKIFKTQSAWYGRSQNFEVKAGEEYVFSAYVKSSAETDRVTFYLPSNSKQPQAKGLLGFESVGTTPSESLSFNLTNEYKRIAIKIKITSGGWIMPRLERFNSDAYLFFGGYKLERGNIATDYSPAPEDTVSQISSLSSQIQQTADGMTLLATKTELNSAKTELQSGITTAISKADNAQSTANNNAQTISTHTTQISALNTGLSAKVSQTDFNTLSGRVTTAENNITAKANELRSEISVVEGKIPTEIGGRNLYALSKNSPIWSNNITSLAQNIATGEISFKVTGQDPYFGTQANKNEAFGNRGVKIPVKKGQDIAVQLTNKLFTKNFVSYFGDDDKAVKGFKGYQTNKFVIPADELEGVSYITFRFGLVAYTQEVGSAHSTKVKVEYGNVYTDWTPAPEDYDSALATAQSEIKQTTDAITASVSSLDKSTVKTATLNLDNNGFVTKVGKTIDGNTFATMIAQDANNVKIIADEMQVDSDMIVDGAITGDKIKANSVDVTKIVGIDADFIKSKIEYAMIDWLKGKSITAYNDNMTIDLQNGRISFKDGSNAVFRQTPDGIHTGFMHFEAGSQGGIYAAFGATSTRQGINSKSSEFAGIRCYRVSEDGDSHDAKIDKIEVIGDTVQFGHGYRSDGSIGGGFVMDTAAFANETPYSLNRVIKSVDALWRVLNDHARNVGFNLNSMDFVNALTAEYKAWHDMHNQ